jgi:hypothetical protein
VAGCHSFCLFFIFYNIHTFIHSITFIQYIYPSPFAEASLHFPIACLLSGKHLPVEPSRELNSGLPYSNPAKEKNQKQISIGLPGELGLAFRFLPNRIRLSSALDDARVIEYNRGLHIWFSPRGGQSKLTGPAQPRRSFEKEPCLVLQMNLIPN